MGILDLEPFPHDSLTKMGWHRPDSSLGRDGCEQHREKRHYSKQGSALIKLQLWLCTLRCHTNTSACSVSKEKKKVISQL